MLRYLLRSLGGHFRSGRTLFALTVLGVALGVASVLSIQILNLNALSAFEGGVRAVGGEADFSIRPRGPRLDEALYPPVLADPDVAAAWPVYTARVAVAEEAESWLEVIGLDLFAPLEIPWQAGPADIGAPLRTPGWVALSPEFAAARGLVPGDRFDVTSGSRRTSLTVGALVDFTRVTPLAGSRMAVMDIAQAQALLGEPGGIHTIEVVARDGADLDAMRERLTARLGPSVETVTPEGRRAEAAGLLSAFRMNLTALSAVSLFVGGFLVWISTRAALLRRREEFGLLRAVGAGRGQVLAAIGAEVGLLAALGVGLGIPLGYGVATLAVERVSATLSNLYLLQEIERLQLPGLLWAIAAVVGFVGAAGGALAPALEIARADPRQLLAAYTLRRRAAGGARLGLLAGIGVMALVGLTWFVLLRGQRFGGFVLAGAPLLALAFAAPWFVRAMTGRLPFRGFGPAYGARALSLRLETTGFAVAALAVAVSMLVGITVMIGSFRRTVEVWLDATLVADVYVTTESWRRGRDVAALDPALVDELAALPGVAHVDRLRQSFVASPFGRIALSAVDFGLPVEGRFELLRGDAATARERVHAGSAALISEPLAVKARLGVGDTLVVGGPRGDVSFEIAGVFYDYSSERGGAAIDLAAMEREFGPGPISNVALYLDAVADAAADSADPTADRATDRATDALALVERLKSRFAESPVMVRSDRDLREEVFRIFDQTFAVTRLLQAMSLLIAATGIALTLIVLARERVAELALYRALGASREQIFGVFLGKGVAIAALGTALGAFGGVLLAMILVFVINRDWFGWTLALHWPVAELARGLGLILVVAAVASVYPALRASGTPATELTRENL